MPVWRLLDTPPMSAADNMALDEVLVELRGEGRTPDTIRFLQFKPRSVLVGYHQSLAEEVRGGYCAENGISVNRRITGGGALFFDENQLGWEVICAKAFFNLTLPTERLFRALCLPVATALARLGIPNAQFRPRNDIEVEGRKISGTGGTESGEAFLFQGTMLVDFDVDTMLRALRIPVEKLKAKEIDSIKERVTCLAWELGQAPSLDAIKAAVRAGFEEHLGITLAPAGLTPEEWERFEERREKFHSMEWIDRVKPRAGREMLHSSYKSEAGMVRVTMAVDLNRQRLRDVYLTGDFLSFPARALYDLEAALRGQPLDQDVLAGIVGEFFASGRMAIPGMGPEDFLIPLRQALEKAAIARLGLPLRHCDRISVTNGSFAEVLAQKPSVLLLPYCAKLRDCDLRYAKGCRRCNEGGCTIGPAWDLGKGRRMRVASVCSFEDLWGELERMKRRGETAFVGCCCQPFFAKHVDDFARAGVPGILVDIDNTTCYDLDQAREAYAGTFESQTTLHLDLLASVLDAAHAMEGQP